MFCLPPHWLYIVFYDYTVFHFVWLILFVISNWHWQWLPCVLGEGVGGSSSVWSLWPPCHIYLWPPPHWYFSAWEQSTNTSCYNCSSFCLFVWFRCMSWFDRKGPRENTQSQHKPWVSLMHSYFWKDIRLHFNYKHIYCCWNGPQKPQLCEHLPVKEVLKQMVGAWIKHLSTEHTEQTLYWKSFSEIFLYVVFYWISHRVPPIKI